MSLTREESELMDMRDNLPQAYTEVIDNVFETLFEQCKWRNLHAAGDDRATKVEAALIRFLIDSNKEE